MEKITKGNTASKTISARAQLNRRKWAKLAATGGFIIILCLLPVFLSSSYTLHIFILTFIYTIATVSLRTITISGQFPLAHGAFMGVGAYSAGLTSRWLGWSYWITIPSAALFTTALGILIGYPFARLRTLYYAMGSLFFGLGVIQVIYAFGDWTGGYSGFYGITPMFTGSKVPYYYFFLGLAVVCTAALYRFEFSRIGTNLRAISQSHMVASSVGINEGWYRVMVVGVGCFFAGIAGACYAHYNLVISAASFNLGATLGLFMCVLVGGIFSFAGPIIGTFVLVLAPEFLRDLKIYSPLVSAAILLIVVYLMPRGLVSLPWLLSSGRSKAREENGVAHAS
ncbi:MAG: branched-chain amino acid ABC transporter permease [Thermodesulfobacteriota bacterium]